jgi:hypothetical protein
MKLPFSIDQFLGVFEAYNSAIWPFQIGLYLAGLVIVLLAVRKTYLSTTVVSIAFAFLWVWMGLVYHLLYFSHINRAAYIFGAAFIVQGALFLYTGLVRKTIAFQFKLDMPGIAGSILVVFALFIYPTLGYLQGRPLVSSPSFGLPCPTTIFTFGILLWTEKKVPVVLLLIPLLWSIIGFSAAFSLGIKEDISLLIAGVAFVTLQFSKNKLYPNTNNAIHPDRYPSNAPIK